MIAMYSNKKKIFSKEQGKVFLPNKCNYKKYILFLILSSRRKKRRITHYPQTLSEFVEKGHVLLLQATIDALKQQFWALKLLPRTLGAQCQLI